MKNRRTHEIESVESNENADIIEIVFRDRLKYSALVSAAIDHGLHTPLIIIKGLAEILLRNSSQDPIPNLRKISKEADHVLKLLESMTFVDTEVPVQLSNISLRYTVERVVIFFEKSCLENGISLKVDIRDSLCVEADPYRLKSILMSLIQNAVDSFDEVSPLATRSIFIHTQELNQRLELVVSDTGSGMSLQVQDHVVNRIFVNKAGRLALQSSLGLSLAQKMADDLGLKLGFVTEKDKGTSFMLSFPCK